MAVTATVDGNYDLNYSAGEAFFSAEGTFGGGTVTVELSKNGTDWGEITSSSQTANGGFVFSAGDGFSARAVVTGSTTPSIELSVTPVSVNRIVRS